MSFFSACWSGAKWVTEKLNLKTDSEIKTSVSSMGDTDIIAKQGSTRRCLASSITGVVLNSALAVACPVFAAGAAISAYQVCVTGINYHRVREQVKDRKAEDPAFEELLKQQNHRKTDIFIGCTVKAGFIALGAGIVGLDHVGENFVQLAHSASVQAVQTAAIQPDIMSAHDYSSSLMGPHDGVHGQQFDASQNIDISKEKLEAMHPHVAGIDENVHKGVQGIGEKVSQALQGVTGWKIDGATSWANLKEMVEHGAGRLPQFIQTLLVGGTSELAQPIVQGADAAQDEGLRELQKRRVERYLKNATPEMSDHEVKRRAELHVMVQREIEQKA